MCAAHKEDLLDVANDSSGRTSTIDGVSLYRVRVYKSKNAKPTQTIRTEPKQIVRGSVDMQQQTISHEYKRKVEKKSNNHSHERM